METRSRGSSPTGEDTLKLIPRESPVPRRGGLLGYLPWVVALAQCFVIIALMMDPLRVECQRRAPCLHQCPTESRGDLDPDELSKGNMAFNGNEFPQTDPMLPVEVPEYYDRLFYNRVPKCGSSSMMDLIIEMSQLNNFTFSRAPEYMRFWIKEEWQRKFARRIFQIAPPMIYERHLHFLNFRKFSMEQPVYINLVRDPLERLSSWYYFRRYQEGHVRDMPTKDRVRTYDECVLGNFTECADPLGDNAEEGYFKLIPFFCGQDDYCRVPGERSLIQAIYNVKRHYSVVGSLERYSEYIEALEYLLPKFFKGAPQVYKRLEEEWKQRHKTTYKLPLSPEARSIMETKLKEEYQFHKFLTNRFSNLMEYIREKKAGN